MKQGSPRPVAAWFGLLVAALLLAAARAHAGAAGDPLDSARWGDMKKLFFADAQVVFDDRVRVTSPPVAEDAMNVPVTIAVEGLGEVRRVVVFADFNPILKVLEFEPGKARPTLGFRMKLQQSSPVRAAALTADGVWHVGGTWIETSGGGCTLPSAGRGQPEWEKRLGEVSSRLWSRPEGSRVRVRVIHPMDTGLAPGIPAFHIEKLVLADEAGTAFMRIETFEPVSENPVFTFDLGPDAQPKGQLVLSGVDNNGNKIRSRLGQ